MGGQLLGGDAGADDDGDEQTGAEELREQPPADCEPAAARIADLPGRDIIAASQEVFRGVTHNNVCRWSPPSPGEAITIDRKPMRQSFCL